MKRILMVSFDMEIGGIERSIINQLEIFDYENYEVTLKLFRNKGEFFNLINRKVKILDEDIKYSSFRKSIKEIIFKDKNFLIGFTRVLCRFISKYKFIYKKQESSYYQMQLMFEKINKYLPEISGKYDAVICHMWPGYMVENKVNANIKIAWIHTDYSKIEIDIEKDLKLWNKFNYIVSISDSVTKSFLVKYPSLKEKIVLIENITSPSFIKSMANKSINEMQDKGEFKLLSVARFSHAKGIDNAVKALKILHDNGFRNIKWYVVGYGGDEDLIKNLIKENQLEESFILLGKKINPYPYMQACDLYVQPSRYEGKAVTVSEAQILGKAVMITNYETAKSQVKDGVDGYISELSIEGIAKGIKELYEDKRLRESLEHMCRNSDYSNSYELQKLYEKIL